MTNQQESGLLSGIQAVRLFWSVHDQRRRSSQLTQLAVSNWTILHVQQIYWYQLTIVEFSAAKTLPRRTTARMRIPATLPMTTILTSYDSVGSVASAMTTCWKMCAVARERWDRFTNGAFGCGPSTSAARCAKFASPSFGGTLIENCWWNCTWMWEWPVGIGLTLVSVLFSGAIGR